MPCFSPLDAWKSDSGEIQFSDRGGSYLQLPCGQCVGCRLERSRKMAVRCMHEIQMHDANCFVTLTYDDDHCPLSLEYRDFQLFCKKARKKLGPFRFYMCGEYGEQYGRPHYHAILFGMAFPDKEKFKRLGHGSWLYRSPTLESLWPHGYSSIGEATFESAAYVARYIMKKVTGPEAAAHYRRVDVTTGEVVQVVPEFTRMSLRPGIGAEWIKKYHRDVYPHDFVVTRNGVKCKPPRYYDDFLRKLPGVEIDEVEFDRFRRGRELNREFTPERLAVREKVLRARLALNKRTLE